MRRELEQVDAMIAELRGQARQIREEVGNREDGPVDPGDTALLISSAEEQEALIEVLEDRRGKLRERLGMGTQG
ncbi:hypothetical protein Cme02nite_71570 [Catellatospora methionotrophica]|uniref:Uncharacterized protein n=2 Tax=Catellatospora methionotrophica TaxID=121620 RepID=A0A8J3LU30_9ACTN|nr:hypothetical protein Cme02nite_71570 [Catellatospora methionotrophica]